MKMNITWIILKIFQWSQAKLNYEKLLQESLTPENEMDVTSSAVDINTPPQSHSSQREARGESAMDGTGGEGGEGGCSGDGGEGTRKGENEEGEHCMHTVASSGSISSSQGNLSGKSSTKHFQFSPDKVSHRLCISPPVYPVISSLSLFMWFFLMEKISFSFLFCCYTVIFILFIFIDY